MKKTLITFGLAVMLQACSTAPSLTPEEKKRQHEIDSTVANALFDYGVDNQASYNIHEDGHVVVLFDKSVDEVTYTKVVNELRSDPRIPSLEAEQDGKTVCPLN